MNTAQATTILAQINAIEAQLAALKQQVQEFAAQNGEPTHTFADLYGLTGGEGNFSEEEIDAALYKLTPEWIEDIATIPGKAE
jgi:prefoldin subunit 5